MHGTPICLLVLINLMATTYAQQNFLLTNNTRGTSGKNIENNKSVPRQVGLRPDRLVCYSCGTGTKDDKSDKCTRDSEGNHDKDICKYDEVCFREYEYGALTKRGCIKRPEAEMKCYADKKAALVTCYCEDSQRCTSDNLELCTELCNENTRCHQCQDSADLSATNKPTYCRGPQNEHITALQTCTTDIQPPRAEGLTHTLDRSCIPVGGIIDVYPEDTTKKCGSNNYEFCYCLGSGCNYEPFRRPTRSLQVHNSLGSLEEITTEQSQYKPKWLNGKPSEAFQQWTQLQIPQTPRQDSQEQANHASPPVSTAKSKLLPTRWIFQ